ncbi:MAG: hypothetical protein FWF73_01890 [Spirochaetes bacterium]|nr:hypothetical protein [Spirochaetota bacterium]
MVFYLAILLILCGLLIVISALFLEINETKIAEEYKPVKTESFNNFKSESLKPENLEIISHDELDKKDNIFSEFEDTFPDLLERKQAFQKDEFDVDGIFHNNINQKIEKKYNTAAIPYSKSDVEFEILNSLERESQLQDKNNTVYAVMFDDKSDIIDYTSGVGTIDSTFLKYKDIKRIGRGVIESDSHGINFYLNEKLYRFDSHRIYDIWCGENYVALPLKGSGIVKLFLIENSADFQYKVEADFRKFEKVSSVI